MKKFLSVLLALTVGFTFTFGSCMSAFAAAYTTDTAKDVLDAAYQSAVATDFDVDYDTISDADNNAANEITVFTVDKAAVQSGIYAAYQAAIGTLTASKVAGVDISDDANKATDIAKVRVALETAATSGANVNDSYEAAFTAYKAQLTSIVNAISTDAYTTTSNEVLGVSKFAAKNGNTYTTSKEAAEADKQWALDAIAKAKFNASGSADADTTKEWNTTYANLYTKVFGEVFTIVLNKDDLAAPTKVTSVSYKMKNTSYSTTAAEKQTAATLEVKKSEAKSKLTSVVTTFEVGASYKAAYANAVEAYKEAMTYLIDTATSDPTGLIGTAITAATTTEITIDSNPAVDYVAISADAKKAKADAASNKQTASIQGDYYDDTKADAALVKVLRQIYAGNAYNSTTQTANGETLYQALSSLTAGYKASLKAARDYSEVEADANGKYKFKTYNTGSLADALYYAKEFEAVKAAVDAYCAAVDAATTSLDIDKAEDAYKAATLEKVIAKAGTVEGIFTSYTNGMLAAYWTKAANGNTIYVTWDEGKTYKTSYADADFIKYAIAKNARTTKEADALYADACAIIDAYKTKAQITAAASAVQAQIAALPTTVALTDKAAVVAAYDAYMAVASDFRSMVANASTLKKDVAAIEKLEATEVIKLVNALPPTSKVTVADKAAVKAACDAYNAWINEEAYKDTKMVASRTSVTDPTDDGVGYPALVKAAELQAIKDAYTPLQAKWSVDKLTAEDAAAVKALQEAVAAYIAEYNEAVPGEATIAQMAKVVEAMVVYTDKDAKAYMFDMKVTATAKKVKKTTAKMTVKADVTELTENGYTVTYKYAVKAPGSKKYVTKKSNSTKKSYTFTKLKKGKNTFKVTITVKNAEGKTVGTKTKTKTYTRK